MLEIMFNEVNMSFLLTTAIGSRLSDYEVNGLIINNINTPLKLASFKLCKLEKLLCSIRPEEIRKLQLEVLEKQGLTPVTLHTLHEEGTRSKSKLSSGTGIQELDNMLSKIRQPFVPGRVWELSGIVGVGKTELFYTLIVNSIINSKGDEQTLFIDTKLDFKATRINEMLMERQSDNEERELVMQSIKINEANTPQEIISTLETLDSQLLFCDEATSRITLVVIDSLPASWIHWRSDSERKQSRYMLNRLVTIIRKLASRYSITFIIGTLSFAFGLDKNEWSIDNDICKNTVNGSQDRPMLGRYWSTVCTLRLLLEYPEVPAVDDEDLRVLKVLNNSHGATGGSCIVHITNAGII